MKIENLIQVNNLVASKLEENLKDGRRMADVVALEVNTLFKRHKKLAEMIDNKSYSVKEFSADAIIELVRKDGLPAFWEELGKRISEQHNEIAKRIIEMKGKGG